MIQISPLIWIYDVGHEAPKDLRSSSIALPQIPSTAFGDGSHPTTRLCATAVDFTCRQHLATNVLDVGTGTGILARIARARGAKSVKATDIDPVAIEAAKRNCELDKAVDPIDVKDAPPDHWGAKFDLVVANILEEPLRLLAPALARAVTIQGTLLISGFTRLQIPSLAQAYLAQGFTQTSESFDGQWALLSFRFQNRV